MCHFFKRKGVNSWKDAKIENYSAWIASLTDNKYAVASLARKLSAIRMLVSYYVSEGELAENQTELIGNPKRRRSLPHCLSIPEMERILSAPDLNTPLGKRDLALLELMYGSGLRVLRFVRFMLTQSTQMKVLPVYLEKGRKNEWFQLVSMQFRLYELLTWRTSQFSQGWNRECHVFEYTRKRNLPKMVWVLVKGYAKKRA